MTAAGLPEALDIDVTAADGPKLHGVARVGAHLVAVPIAGIREVVPHPPRLAALPATLPEMRGGLDLRGALVPVIDLALLLGSVDVPPGATDEPAGQNLGVIMILRTAKGVFGVCVDEICGVMDLARQRQTALELVPGQRTGLSGIVASGFSVSGQTGVVLNVDGMTALPGLMVAEDRLVADAARLTAGPPVLTFAVGDYRFGLCADTIEATLPRGPVLPSPVDDPVWIGRITTNGSHLPLVDTLALLGLGTCPQRRDSASVVVRLAGGGRVALCIDSVIDMVRMAPDETFGLQGFTLGEGGIIAGLQGSGPPILMLDGAVLAAHRQLISLAGLVERDDTAGPGGAKTKGEQQNGTVAAGESAARQPFLIFMLGDEHHAAPMDQVTEILPFDAGRMIDLGHAPGPFCAMIAHRGASVPVIDLARAGADRSHDPQESKPRFILIAASAQRSVGFLLDGLCAVERHVMRPVAHNGDIAQVRGLPGPVIRTRDGRTCSVQDLSALIERVHGQSCVVAA